MAESREGSQSTNSEGREPRLSNPRRAQWQKLLTLGGIANGPLGRRALGAVALTGLGTAISYPVQIFVSRTLGVAEYGKYAYVLSIMNVASLLAGLDLGHAALRFMGQYCALGEWSLVRGFVHLSRRLVGATSLSSAIIGSLVIWGFRSRLEASLVAPLLAGCVLLIPATFIQLELNLLQGLKRAYAPRVPNLIVRPVAFALALLAVSQVLTTRPRAEEAILANAVGVSVALALSVYFLHRAWPPAAREVSAQTRAREWVGFSSTTLAGSIFYLILSQQADVIVVGSFVGTTEVGLYSAASQISAIVGMGVVAVGHVGSPMIASFNGRRAAGELRTLVQRLSVLMWVVALPIVALVGLGGRLLLGTFGPEFRSAYPVLAIMLVGQTINALWGNLWGIVLTMMGYQKESFAVVVIVATFNLVLTLVLTPQYGVIGAAVATAASVALRGIIIAWLVQSKLGFWPFQSGGR